MPRETYKYGCRFDSPPTELENELSAFRNDPKPEVGGLGKAEHFWNICAILWGPKSRKEFWRHPWAEKMAAYACTTQYLGLAGAANSGKSDFGAVWAIVNWLCAPKDTLVIATSTSFTESGKRIWGAIKQYYSAANLEGIGKLVESIHAIRTNDGSGVFDEREGIYLVAAEKSKEKDAVKKLIGAKNKRVFVIADELPELTESILEAAYGNLAMNETAEKGSLFQLVGIGNFKSYYDPFGIFVTPKDGYGSISVDMDEWETEKGVCLHFDGMRSPNILGGEDKYPRIYGSKHLANHRKDCGVDSAAFWRMCRSFPTPMGMDNILYSRADLNAGQADFKIPSGNLSWLGPRTRLSSLDPSYTNGGDRTVQWFGWWGVLTNGIWCLSLDNYKLLRDEVGVKKPRDYQIVRQFRDNCIAERVDPRNAAFDGTAATSFGAIISEEWSPQVLKVEFGGAPSARPVSANDPRTARDLYDRRVSELWGVGREFVRAGQIKGVTPELSRELEARHYETSKRGGNVITVVETKADMKKRLGFSPDLADAFFVMLELVRNRHGALAGGVATGQRAAKTDFFKIAKEKDRVYSELYAEADY